MTNRPPLAGVRVLELSHIIAGPSGGLLFADLGAEVIKVEEPTAGDQARGMPNYGSAFYALNRDKQSIAIDLKQAEGRSVFARLVQSADVVLDNYAPGVLDRLGIGYAQGSAWNPRIIYCAIKGFLPAGPYGDRPLLDELAQMMGSMAYMTGPLGTPLAGPSVIDIGSATYGVLATVAALFDREKTGEGQHITAGLFETTVFLSIQHVAQAAITGESPLPMPSKGMGSRLGWGVYQLFTTADDRQVFIAIVSNAHWQRFCTELGLLDLRDDPDLDSNPKRCENRPRVIPRIEAVAGAMTSSELVAKLEAARVPYSPVNTPLDVLDDPQVLGSGLLHDVRTEDGRTLHLPGLPVASDTFAPEPRCDPPSLGRDTRPLMRKLGYPDAEIERLISAGVIRADGPMLTTETLPGAR